MNPETENVDNIYSFGKLTGELERRHNRNKINSKEFKFITSLTESEEDLMYKITTSNLGDDTIKEILTKLFDIKFD